MNEEIRTLTKKERLTLINQFRILAAVSPREADEYGKLVKVLESGYVREYYRLTDWLGDEIDENLCSEVADIFQMYEVLDRFFKTDKASEVESVPGHPFAGFDGNNEYTHLGYAHFLVEDCQKWEHVEVSGKDLNSHCPLLPSYRRMLAVWRGFGDDSRTHVSIEQATEMLTAFRAV